MATERPLGFRPLKDDASRAYPAPRALTRHTVQRRVYGGSIDQGNTNGCTGHAIAHALNTTGIYRLFTRTLKHGDANTPRSAMGLYSAATRLDPWPFTWPPTDGGSSALAACKAAKNAGLISSYRWCFGLQHTLAALTLAPVIVGTTWTTGMYTPDTNGIVHATGTPEGGHAYTLTGLNVEDRTVTAINSWGPDWGIKGRFRIGWDDLGQLLADNGEAVTVTR